MSIYQKILYLLESFLVMICCMCILQPESFGQKTRAITISPTREQISTSVTAQDEVNSLCCGMNYALSFDGGDRIIIPDHISLNPSEITVECWVKFRRLAYSGGLSDAQTLIVKGGDRTTGTYELRQGGPGPDDHFAMFAIDRYWYNRRVISSTKRWHLNKWYHLAGTYDGQYVRIYVNGEKKGEKYIRNISFGNTSPLYFGFMDVPGFPYYLDGVMDEVRIWSYARSEAEIQTAMYCLPTGKEVGLLGYWNFDEGTGQTVQDLTGNQNHGQLGTNLNVNSDDPTWVLSDRPMSGDGLLRVNITAINPILFPKVSVATRIVDTTSNAVTGLDTSHISIQEDFNRQEIGALSSGFFDSTKADFVFVFDTTISMQPYIDALKNKVKQFANSMKARGIDYALGLVVFGDPYQVWNNGNLTSDVDRFQKKIDSVICQGGNDRRENPFDALVAATSMTFRYGAQKIFIMITDAPPHTNTTPGTMTKLTLKAVCDTLVRNNVACYVVGIREPEYLGSGSLSDRTGGKFFDITANFGGILDEITKCITGQYEIKFTTTNKVADGSQRMIIVPTNFRCRSGSDTAFYRVPDKTFPLRTASDSDHYYYGNEFWIEVKAGNKSSQVKGLYGLSFALTYDQTAVKYVVSQPGPFLGTKPLFNVWPDSSAGKLKVGITRLGGPGAFGQDTTIARFKFLARDNEKDSVKVDFGIKEALALDSVAVQMPVIPESNTITLIDSMVTVWPGDTDNNGRVYGEDIMYIGLYWAKTDHPRPNASTNWIGQPCRVWKPKKATYADANGDGMVGQPDIDVVNLNWGKVHSLSPQFVSRERKAPLTAGQIMVAWETAENRVIISVGLSGIKNMSGVMLEWSYPAMIVEVIAVNQGKNPGSDALLFSHDEPEAGRLCFVVCLRDREQGLSDNLEVAKISLRAKSDAIADLAARCHIEKARWLNVEGELFDLDENNNMTKLPTAFRLWQNYPNPFNPVTRIKYDLPKDCHVILQVFNIAGRVVRTLKDEMMKAGSYESIWDGLDDNNHSVASGVYFIKIETLDFKAVKKGILIR